MNHLFIENKFIISLLLVAVTLIIRGLVVHRLNQLTSDEDGLPRRWINTTKNTATFLILIGLIIIWLSELQYLALSIATFIVALVIATREFIQCFMGAMYHASTRTFSIGDWIKVGDYHGEVTHSDWLSTTLLEVDLDGMTYGYTGKTLIVPNNQFVIHTIQNLNFMRRYVAHSFDIVRDEEFVNIFEAKSLILKKAEEYCAPFHEVAQRYNDLIEKRLGIEISGPEANIRITTSNLGKNIFTVTLFCPTDEAINIEQQLTEDFMEFWYKTLKKNKHEKIK